MCVCVCVRACVHARVCDLYLAYNKFHIQVGRSVLAASSHGVTFVATFTYIIFYGLITYGELVAHSRNEFNLLKHTCYNSSTVVLETYANNSLAHSACEQRQFTCQPLILKLLLF